MVWTTNADGEVDVDIPMWREFTGQSEEAVKGWGWLKAVHPDDREGVAPVWKEAVATKSPYEVEYRVRKHNGSYRHFLARGVPVLEEDGRIREWVGTCTDITELKRFQEMEKKAAETKMAEAVIDVMGDGLFLRDRSGKITAVNPAFEKMTGYEKSELVGKDFVDLARKLIKLGDLERVMGAIRATLEGGVPTPISFTIFTLVRKDGREIPTTFTTSFIKDAGGNPTTAVVMFKDITELKRVRREMRIIELERQVKELEERLKAS